MSTDEKLFIRKMWRTFVTAVIVQLVAGLIIGIGVLNRDHFKVQGNSSDIIKLDKKIDKVEGMSAYYVSNDRLMEYIALLEKKNTLLENVFIDLRIQNNAEFDKFRSNLAATNLRIDQIMMNYSKRGGKLESNLLNGP